jgi:hypothetical protein
MPSATMFLTPYMAHTYFFCMIDEFSQKFDNLLAFFETQQKAFENAAFSRKTLLNFFRGNII